MVRAISFPTKEKPSNSVRYSARSFRRMAMQYRVNPAPNTMDSSPVRMETKVDRTPASPANADTMFKNSRSRPYSAVMALGETWAPESSSRTSSFSLFLSISSAVMIGKFLRMYGFAGVYRQIDSISLAYFGGIDKTDGRK